MQGEVRAVLDGVFVLQVVVGDPDASTGVGGSAADLVGFLDDQRTEAMVVASQSGKQTSCAGAHDQDVGVVGVGRQC